MQWQISPSITTPIAQSRYNGPQGGKQSPATKFLPLPKSSTLLNPAKSSFRSPSMIKEAGPFTASKASGLDIGAITEGMWKRVSTDLFLDWSSTERQKP